MINLRYIEDENSYHLHTRPQGRFVNTVSVVSLTVLSLVTLANAVQAETVTKAQNEYGLHKAYQEWLARKAPSINISEEHDTLSGYAQKCDLATGIHVPGFNCDAGTEVPGQGNGTICDQPNVLNGKCDPGSRFQVLPGRTADAVAVAHCRKDGSPANGSLYNDIAVIQYNKKNGATCFYQALGDRRDGSLPGRTVPAPLLVGEQPWQPGSPGWLSPAATEGIGCTGCHDNGAFIRSEYLAQLNMPPNVLPNWSDGFDNQNTPVKYVGLDYTANKSWSIEVSPARGDNGPSCTTCHRLAVPNRMAFGTINGTAANFASIATAATQASKNPHSPTSPIWMRPGQITYDAAAEATAKKFHDCAVGFFNSRFRSAPRGCVIRQLGEPWVDQDGGNQGGGDGIQNLAPLFHLLLN